MKNMEEQSPFFWYTTTGLIIIFLTFLTKFKPKHKFTSLPPSPPSLTIIGHLHLLKHPVHRTLHSLSSKLGKILLLKWGSRAVLLVSSPSAAEECYTKHDVAFANRPSLLAGKHFHYNFTTVAAASYSDHWRNLRRVMTLEFFSSSRLAAFSALRQGEVRLLLNQIMKKSKVELKSKFTELAFNVMTMTVVGKRYFGEDLADDEEAKNFREVIREAVHLSAATNLGDFLPVLQWMDATGLEKKMVRLMKKMDGFLQSLIEERRGILAAGFETNGAELKKLMIDNFLALQQTDPQLYTDEIVKGIILVLLVAGTDTTSTTLEWAMALLLNHPGAMAKLRAEIDTKTGSDHRLLEEQDLPNLNYLQNVINETYRLYPSFPILVPHENSEDCVVGGFDVPHHTMLVINAWAIHRNPEIWEDPEKFKPERFEGWSGEGSEGYKLIPFGAGRRRCPGASLANKLVGLALGSLVQSFEWERIGEEEVDMSEGLGLTMPRVKSLEAICKPRPIMLSSM
ncbi:hypothetical protein C1H46_015159 [Malus baccata]|uniref:Cytochrome P450 n=1 Tax=Malus baccata TaxID=106549 RepID=A0A540MKD6_MALBA|nr:hypothetical protein C1H46_015159 [Malus baccata]